MSLNRGSPHTVRYYDRLGLLPPPPREGAGGYRRYRPDAVERLRLIRDLKGVGFTLADIDEVLRLVDDPASCAPVQALIRRRLHHLREQIARLTCTLEMLEKALERCSTAKGSGCHLFESGG